MKINVQKRFTLDGHKDCLYALTSGDRPAVLYSASGDGMVVAWDLQNPENGRLLARMKNSVYALAFLTGQNTLLAGQNFEGIHFIDTIHQKEVASLELEKNQIYDIKIHEDRAYIGTGDGVLYVMDLQTRSLVKRVKLSDKSIRAIAINSGLNDIALGLSDNSIRILSLPDLTQKLVINAHKLSVFALQYDPRTNMLLSASRDAHLKRWDSANNYQLEKSVVAHTYAINTISLSPDGQLFATGSMDKTIKVWDTKTMTLLKVIDRSRHAGHTSSVNKVLWTNHENLLISCGDDKNIIVWDLGVNY
ncbi:MAG: WD40 repeat domain-containing protein [Cyclobacteriaceae bacterium]|nr:WD40 repeat domain-containing protein [Cyclobacteriaceae bacterium]